MMKEITKFAVKAIIIVGLIVIAAVILDWYGVINFGRYSSKVEANRVELENAKEEIKSQQAGEAQEAIAAILAASKVQFAETGQWATDVSQFQRLQLDRLTKDHWKFNIVPGTKGIHAIHAISNGKMAGGAGKIVSFDATLGTWSGYGFD